MKSIPQLSIYEINTAAFLHDLSERAGKRITLGSVPDRVWDEIATLGMTTVWFMGVWKRSPIARSMALKEPFIKKSLPDLKPDDVYGSAYSIKEYVVDSRFGGDTQLAIARQALKKRGIKLMLDYVPNHVAIDHPWTTYHPEYFLPGSPAELAAHPKAFVQVPSGIVAKAKDPHYEPWSDVVQLNAFSISARQEFADTLVHIASMCDAVRCDMAMLMTNDIFAKTWGRRAGEVPDVEFWPGIIKQVKRVYPQFIFLAEVYWKKEQLLIDQGFDFCYDKEFYDDLIDPAITRVHKRLNQPLAYQRHLLRFIENHDEPRVAKIMSIAQHKAAAIILAMSQSGVLYHEGQFQGWKLKVPVQLARRPAEQGDVRITKFYEELRGVLGEIDPQNARRKELFPRTNFLFKKVKNVIAYQYNNRGKKYVIAVNYSDQKVDCVLGISKLKVEESLAVNNAVLNDKIVHFKAWGYIVVRLA